MRIEKEGITRVWAKDMENQLVPNYNERRYPDHEYIVAWRGVVTTGIGSRNRTA